jgi:hypothetical protein
MREWITYLVISVVFSGVFTYKAYAGDSMIYADSSEEPTGKQVYALPTINVCGSISGMIASLESDKYGERGIASGSLYIRNGKTNQIMMGDLYVFINPETLEYTLLAVFVDDNQACILGTGEGFGPYSADIEVEIDGIEM